MPILDPASATTDELVNNFLEGCEREGFLEHQRNILRDIWVVGCNMGPYRGYLFVAPGRPAPTSLTVLRFGGESLTENQMRTIAEAV